MYVGYCFILAVTAGHRTDKVGNNSTEKDINHRFLYVSKKWSNFHTHFSLLPKSLIKNLNAKEHGQYSGL